MNYTEDQMTGWYNLSDQKPWEPGVYEVPCRFGSKATYFSYWCGIGFHGGWNTVERAIQQKNHSIEPSYKKWRGLASDPSAKPKPKPKGNRKVTRYVVTSDGDAVAAFASKALAEAYAKSIEKRRASVVWVEKIRFRTPEHN